MKTIVAGVDFTQSSYNAARYAAKLAAFTKSKLILFNLFDVPMIHSNSGLYFMSYSSIRDSSTNALHRFANKLKKEFTKQPIDYFVATGSFKSELATFIKKNEVTYVVLGLAVKNRFSKFLYGSHTTDIAGKLDVPVVIVPEQYKEHRLQKALLCVDNAEKLHKSSVKGIQALVKKTGATLKVLHVRTENEIFNSRKADVKINSHKLPVEVISASSLDRGLKKYLPQNRADAVILISHSHSVFYNLFNETNTKAVAFSSKVPVISIHQ